LEEIWVGGWVGGCGLCALNYYTLQFSLQFKKITVNFSQDSQQALGTIHYVDLTVFFRAAFTGLLFSPSCS
jgi:hypothetical protein